MKLFAFLFPLLLLAVDGAEPTRVSIWPYGVPGSEDIDFKAEKSVLHQNERIGDYTRVSQVHDPSITVYLPDESKASGTGVVVLPGGGFRFLSIDLEGSEIADWLNAQGIAAFVLKYRLPKDEGSAYSFDDTVADAHQALRLVRSRASEWAVGPDRIGMMGFSASGETVGKASVTFDYGDPDASDPLGRFSSRPDFQILVYGGYIYEEVLPESVPPAFLVVAHDDGNKPSIAVDVYSKLLEVGVSAELHIFRRGGHAYGMRSLGFPVNSWNLMLKDWMTDLGVLSK